MFETKHRSETVTFEIKALELREKVHILELAEPLVVEVKFLIQMESSVVLFKVF